MSTKVNVINLTGHPVYSLPAADHGGESEDEVALADVVADAVAVHDEGAEAHEGLGGAAHLEADKFKLVKEEGSTGYVISLPGCLLQ